MKKTLSRRIALSGLFLALALIVSLVESLIPPVVPALPYAKLGLGNVVLLACFLLVGAGEGCVVLVLECVIAALYSGNISRLEWSLPAAADCEAISAYRSSPISDLAGKRGPRDR